MKPMSEKQKNAIAAVTQLLGIEYNGEPTAQGAFFFLRDHIENAREELNKQIKAQKEANIRFHGGSTSSGFGGNPIMDKMVFYRFEDAQHELGDEDETYAETPTIESLDQDVAFWLRSL